MFLQVVIAGECFKLHKDNLIRSGKVRAVTNHFLILNLAVADLLMGFYLICLGIYDYIYRGQYCINSVGWLSSNTCQILGVLVILSSQTSVLTLALLSTFRLIAVIKVSVLIDFNNAPNRSVSDQSSYSPYTIYVSIARCVLSLVYIER